MSVRNAREGGGQLVDREHRGEVTGGEWRRDETVCVCVCVEGVYIAHIASH